MSLLSISISNFISINQLCRLIKSCRLIRFCRFDKLCNFRFNKFFLSGIFLLQFLVFNFTCLVNAHPDFQNIDDYKTKLGFQKYYSYKMQARRPLKVAILDKGFYGYEKEIGRTLPSNTKYEAGPIANPENLKSNHGLRMAQIFISLLTNDLKASQWIPELSLYNVFGYSNFKYAIDQIIAQKVDLVLYSEVWEYGGNFDGGGFINKEVSGATQSGIVWVNAAGNFSRTTYNSVVKTGQDHWVELPNQNKALSLKCKPIEQKNSDKKNNKNKCQVKIVLSWNSFSDDMNEGTDKDLDLALTDDILNLVQVSSLRQSKEKKGQAIPVGSSKYPREIISAELEAGQYFIRVKDYSHNFNSSNEKSTKNNSTNNTKNNSENNAEDTLRITVDGEFIELPSASSGESLLNPADNPNVITVGALDSDRSSFSLALGKPDILAPSSIILSDGNEFRGSSNSAAIVAAGFALLKTINLSLDKEMLLQKTSFYNLHNDYKANEARRPLPSEYVRNNNPKRTKEFSLSGAAITNSSSNTDETPEPDSEAEENEEEEEEEEAEPEIEAGAEGDAGLSLELLAFTPTTRSNCFVQLYYPELPSYLQYVINQGGVFVDTSAGPRIMLPYDPIRLDSQLRRYSPNDMIVISAQGFGVFPRFTAIPNGAVEVFQQPIDSAGLCIF